MLTKIAVKPITLWSHNINDDFPILDVEKTDVILTRTLYEEIVVHTAVSEAVKQFPLNEFFIMFEIAALIMSRWMPGLFDWFGDSTLNVCEVNPQQAVTGIFKTSFLSLKCNTRIKQSIITVGISKVGERCFAGSCLLCSSASVPLLRHRKRKWRLRLNLCQEVEFNHANIIILFYLILSQKSVRNLLDR